MENLNVSDFKTISGGTLILNRKGAYLVLIFSEQDPNSQKYFPIFQKLTGSYKQISYGVVDIRKNPGLVSSSRQSTTPIQAVPSLLLYVDSFPRAKMPPKVDIGQTIEQIREVLKTSAASRPKQQRQPERPQSWMPEVPQKQQRATFEGRPPPSGMGMSSGFQEEENLLLTPDSVIPYNTPWNADKSGE